MQAQAQNLSLYEGVLNALPYGMIIADINGKFIYWNKNAYPIINEKVLVTLQGKNIRISPNFFNIKEEIQTFLRILRQVEGEKARKGGSRCDAES